MHLDINIVSPPPFYFSLVNPMNFLNLSSSTYTLVRGMSALYQSPMMNIPIHRGKIYTVGPVPKKPKLSRAMGSLHLKVNMLPLVLGLFEELEEDNQSGVGMRCKAERMDIDMKFVQNVVKSKKAQSESPEQEIQHMATRWSLEASEISFSELEGRAISFGNALQKLKEKSPSLASDLDSLGGSSDEDELSFFLEEGLHEWVVEEDLRYLDSVSQIKMIPFLWSPKMTISKRRDEDTNFSLEKSVRSETGIYPIFSIIIRLMSDFFLTKNY